MHQANIILASKDDFEAQAAHFIVSAIHRATQNHGHCTLGLSGGSTPMPVYRLIREEKKVDWAKLMIFLVDERFVTPDDPRSNQRMIRQTLLADHPLSEEQIFLPDTSLPLYDCVAAYNRAVRELRPSLVVLGMGDDGHIASLFPPLPPSAHGPSAVIHTTTGRFDVHDRISVTLPVLQSAEKRLFLLSGEAKYALLQTMVSAPKDIDRFPAHALLDENTTWIVRTS